MGNANRPTPEFRREAVRLALTSGRTQRETAEDFGIGVSTLTRWLSQERDASEPSEAPVDVHAELKRLRRENAVLKQERDIFKKGVSTNRVGSLWPAAGSVDTRLGLHSAVLERHRAEIAQL